MNEVFEHLQSFSSVNDSSEILTFIAENYGESSAFSTSLGQEDQVITDMIYSEKLPIEIFTLDTGRLFPETYDLLGKTNLKYNQKIKVYFPQHESVQNYVSQNGVNAFYESLELRKSCCHIRKIEPLKRALKNKKVWVTGLRSEQSKNRSSLQVVEWDDSFKIVKVNPLVNWTLNDVKNHLEKNNVPQNSLHKKGFVSIGCQPCTRAIKSGEDIRAGRWWWEKEDKKECGLHISKNTKLTARKIIA